MTEAADDNARHDKAAENKPAAPEGHAEAKSPNTEAGKALATAGMSPVNPFLAMAAEAEEKSSEAPVPARSFASRLLDYSAHAAIIVGLIGFAWTVSSHVINHPAEPKSDSPAAVASAPAKTDEIAQIRQANLRMHEEIKALKASVEALRTASRRDTTPEQVRMLSAGLETVKGSLGSMRNETSSAIAQLSGKVDRLQPGKVRDLTDRVGRLEHQSTDQMATGSIGKSESRRADLGQAEKSAPPRPPVKPAALAKVEEPHDAKSDDKPQTIAGMYVRDVYRGVALVEGRRGTMEVMPGMTIPGAGVVKSIERRGANWAVVTSKGEIAYAAPTPRRQAPSPYGYGRGGYAPYRYGY